MKKVIMKDGFSVQIYPSCSTVELDAEKALKAIGQQFGLYYDVQDDRDMRVVVAGIPEAPALELQENISRHGSPCWDTVKILTMNAEEIEMYQHFQAVLKYIRKST